MTWIRLRDKKPPTNVNILILVDGRIQEGYLDSLVLMGNTEPTEFHTSYRHGYEHAQHCYWGDDPYWMHIPEKPKQITTVKRTFYEVKKDA